MMNVKRWIKTLSACAVVFVALASFKVMEIRAAIAFGESFPEHSEAVESIHVGLMPFVETISVIGDTLAPQQVELRSEIPGRIAKVGFDSGSFVKKGQLLLQQDIGEEQARLDSADARLVLATSVYRRVGNLRRTNAVSQEQLDRALADLATIKADIAELNSTINKKTIRAPFDGVTGIHQFEVGQFLLDNVAVTTLVGEQNYLWVDFQLPQFYPSLANGTQVKISKIQRKRPASGESAYDWADGQVIARSSVATSINRSFKYRAKVASEGLRDIINAGVVVEVPIAPEQTLRAVPSMSVLQDHLGEYVYLLTPDERGIGYRAQRQQVTAINRQGDWTLITEGLEENQLVAADGAFKLYPGLLVRTQPPEQPIQLTYSRTENLQTRGDHL